MASEPGGLVASGPGTGLDLRASVSPAGRLPLFLLLGFELGLGRNDGDPSASLIFAAAEVSAA
ncbi:MAG: hypothetical protein ACLQMH_02035 [Solirubrobacteraceae bacterium]